MKAKADRPRREASRADQKNGEPVVGSPSPSSRQRPPSAPSKSNAPRARRTSDPRQRGAPPIRKLIETPGPEPAAKLVDLRLTVGTIAGTHGVRGELRLHLLTDHPRHLTTIKRIHLGDEEEPRRLLGVRFHGEQALIRIEGVTSPEAGRALRGLPVRIAGTDARPLEEGEYFLFQLIGLRALTEEGRELGTVTDLIETGAHDVLVIGSRSAASGELLVPNHPEFVIAIDPEGGTITLRPPVYEDEASP